MSQATNDTGISTRVLARGNGWRITQVHCRLGQDDAATTEWHAEASASLVLDGLFEYEGERGRSLLTPGAILLGNRGAAYRCTHDHGIGDHCVSCQFDADLLRELDAPDAERPFRATRVSPRADTLALRCKARELTLGADPLLAEELSLELLQQALRQQGDVGDPAMPARTRAAVARTARRLADDSAAPHTLHSLSALAAMSRHAYLRAFRKLAGVTPYQYLLQCRLADAAQRLLRENLTVTAVASATGFGDLSEFTRRFQRHFGQAPGAWRAARTKRQRG